MIKAEEKLVTPKEALTSLQKYHESVMILVNTCEFAVNHGLIDAPIVVDIKDQILEVKKFYQTN